MIYSVRQKPIENLDNRFHKLPAGGAYATASSSLRSLYTSEEDLPPTGDENRRLADRILARIEARLPRRIRKLTVYASENAVVLAGTCSTYYTKQVAQHAAMGVLEYERLINNIDVSPGK